jgi:tyrosine-specific transport protein
MVMITSFGYAIIIPSLRSYFKSDVKKLKLVILIGSCIPFIIYLLWITAVQGLIPRADADGLLHIAESGHVTSLLMSATSKYVQSPWIGKFSDIFISICAITSFLGVSLCLTDFIADGLKIKKQGRGNIFIYSITFLPPLLIIILAPTIFIKASNYAGILCVILLILLPIFMLYSGRYIKTICTHRESE